MVKEDLADIISKAVKITKRKAEESVYAILNTIKEGLNTDGEFYIRGFGYFGTKNKAERIGRNPKNGETAIITARRVVTFKAYKPLKKQINLRG